MTAHAALTPRGIILRRIDVLRARADVRLTIGDYDRALADAVDAFAAAMACDEGAVQADCLMLQGRAHCGHSRFAEMERCARQALDLARTRGDLSDQAAALNNLAMSLAYRGACRPALDALVEALSLHRSIDDEDGRAYTLGNIGFMHNALGDNDAALAHHRRSLALRQRLGEIREQASSLDNIGTALFKLGDPLQALAHYQESLRLRMGIGDRSGQATCLNNIGYLRQLAGDYCGTLDCYRQALRLREATGDRAGHALVLQNIAILNGQLGDYRHALAQSEQALAVRNELDDRSGAAYSHIAVARLLIEQGGDTQQVAAHLDAAAAIAAEIEEPEIGLRIADARTELALARADTGAAGIFCGEARKLAERLRSKQGQARTALLGARIDAALGRVEAAQAGFREAIAVCQELQQAFETAGARLRFAEFQMSRDAEAAREHLDAAAAFFTRIGNRTYLERIERLQSDPRCGRHRGQDAGTSATTTD